LATGLRFSKLGIPEADIPILLRGDRWNAPATRYLDCMQILNRRQLFRTKGGRFGFTMRGVLPGDRICALDGAPVPHVIRRASGEDGGEMKAWRFVADAYVHGLINGEGDETDVEERDVVFV
jgi:hypothetical protein